MILSTTFTKLYWDGLYECPDVGAMTDGISGFLYFERTSVYAPQASSTGSSKIDCFLILLSYLGFGNGTPLDLNLLGSRGFLTLSPYSSTYKGEANCSLTFWVCCYSICYNKPDTSTFLIHFFLFCFPLSPLTLMSSAMIKTTTIDYN